jgi:MFS superfamily sulfate permease-like transporter
MVYSVGLIEPRAFRDIARVRRMEFVWAIAAFLGVMLLGTLKGIVVAIVVSLIALSQQVANPPVHVLARVHGTSSFRPRSPDHPDDEIEPGLLLVRVEGRVFFLNAERVAEQLRALMIEWQPRVVVLDFSSVVDLEYSALSMLTAAEARQREAGIEIGLAGVSPSVAAVISRSPLGAALGKERIYLSLEDAVARYRARHRTIT